MALRTDLSPSLIHHLGGSFFRPSYLVEIVYGTDINNPAHVWRWCTNQDAVSWNSYTWNLMGFSVNGLSWDTKVSSKISLEIQNLDNVMAGLVLNTPLADKLVNIYMLYLYDRNLYTASSGNTSGSGVLTVNESIPSDVPATGSVYTDIGTALTGAGSTSYSYTSYSGNTFTLSSTLAAAVTTGTICYTVKTAYNATDAVQVFSGVIDDIDFDDKKCQIALVPESTKTQYTPRKYISKATGFNFLPQTGLKINWGNEVFTLDRAKY